MTKTVFITGATAGYRRGGCARRFVARGWRVIGTGRRARPARRRWPTSWAMPSTPLELDMRDHDGGRRPGALPSAAAAIDLLLNNAGLAPPIEPLQDAELEPIEAAIDTNVTGLVALTRALLPGLIERKGAIINLSSVAATYPYRGGAVYAGTKAFVRQFSLGLRCDLAGTGVRVTSIEPGMAETEFTLVRTGGDQAASRRALCRDGPDDRRGHRRDDLVGRDPAAAPQHQRDRADAGQPELGRLRGAPARLDRRAANGLERAP